MSSSKNMTVSVAGIDVTIQTDEDRGYVQHLAGLVDAKVVEYLKMGARVTVAQAAVLTALEFCDEFEKNNAAVENMRAQMRTYIDDSISAANEKDRLRAELERVKKQLEQLQRPRNYGGGYEDSDSLL